MTAARPDVRVEQVINEHGDITHCVIQIGNVQLDAPFTESSSALQDRIDEETGVDLTVAEVMAVTNASRDQMVLEASRVEQMLRDMPYGSVINGNGTDYWVARDGTLLWDQTSNFGSKPTEVNPLTIDDIGEIDTHELHAVAEELRQWRANPVCMSVDPNWLTDIEPDFIKPPVVVKGPRL